MQLSMVSIPVQDPILAHEIYTTKLGFISKEFNPKAMIAVIVSPEDQYGTTILLEPCKDTFYEDFQKSAYSSNLPIMIFKTNDVKTELIKLQDKGITIRKDLDNPKYGLTDIFEDGCGNLLMLQEG